MNQFSIKGETGFIRIIFDEVYGFPDTTCPWGGYDVRSILEIKSGTISLKSVLYTSTGEIYKFYKNLKTCNDIIKGEVEYKTHEGNFNIKLSYDNLGHILIKGQFTQQSKLNNQLSFEIESDQSYIKETLDELKLINEKYGDMTGLKEKILFIFNFR